jgi:urea transport system permease protein
MLVLLLGAAWPGTARADALETHLLGLGAGSRSEILASIEALAELDDPKALAPLEALIERRLYSDGARLYVVESGEQSLVDALTGEVVDRDTSDLRAPAVNNLVRRAVKPLIAQLSLRSDDPMVRLAAAESLRSQPSAESREPIRRVLESETDPRVRTALLITIAQVDLQDEDREKRLAAISIIAELGDRALRSQLEELVADADGTPVEQDPLVREAAQAAIAQIDRALFFIDFAGNLFYGLSLASILLLAALGLAITFGLMGVINMAHGEMLMIGAYTTYVVLGLFERHLPALLDAYLVAAVPAAFLICGLLGVLLERTVIRFLYGRPLETLLATWGISLILIQSVRLLFGAQNVEVANPSWLSGGYDALPGIVLPWSRIAILLFVSALVALVYLTLQRTRLGLWVRAVTQNRRMAASLGIATPRVDMLTFGLGSGIAGLGGVALSQIGNVGPELGQSYIVDSFMVVVLGGVGKLVGTVVAALGLGIVNKLLEPFSGAVLGKIFVLAFLILFIQRRPQGIFALQGRAAES